MEQQLTIYSNHPNFNFEEAKKVAEYCASCEVGTTVTYVSYALQYDRKQINRFLKVAIIFRLISRAKIDKIIDNKCKVYSKYSGAKAKDIRAYENYAQLAEEREKLINKMKKMLMMFSDDINQEKIKAKYIPQIIKIEKEAFR